MRSKSKELMKKIQQYAEQFCISNLRTPSTGEIAQALKVSKATVHNYLKAMDEQGMLSYQGGELRTRVTQQINMAIVFLMGRSFPFDPYVRIPSLYSAPFLYNALSGQTQTKIS